MRHEEMVELSNWLPIQEAPGYSVSDQGLVRNDSREKLLTRRLTAKGYMYVGLAIEGRQTNRLVSKLVAKTFIEPITNYKEVHGQFDTPIHLDGDKVNASASNLMWRPLWFARKYHNQFLTPRFERIRIRDIEHDELYPNPLSAAMRYGVLSLDVFSCAWNYTNNDEEDWPWPIAPQFELYNKNR